MKTEEENIQAWEDRFKDQYKGNGMKFLLIKGEEKSHKKESVMSAQ